MYSINLRGLFIIGFPIWLILRIIHLRKNNIKFNIRNEIFTNLFVVYLFILIGITIFPIFQNVIRNVLGNLLLLSPFILYLCTKYEKIRNLKSSAKAALLISLSIELTQLAMNVLELADRRVVHVEDLILNTIGGIIAWYIFKCMYKVKITSPEN